MQVSPEQIHANLWLGSSVRSDIQGCIKTGFTALDELLPGGGWPAGALTDLLITQAGIGEIQFLKAAFQAALSSNQSSSPIFFVNPPHAPNAICWRNWDLPLDRLIWIRSKKVQDASWVAEQILRSHHCTALVCWLDPIRSSDLRKLHLLAQASGSLFFLFRPLITQQTPSPAPLRLTLSPIDGGIKASIFKRRGPVCERNVEIFLPPYEISPHHARPSLDWPAFERTEPQHALAPMVARN